MLIEDLYGLIEGLLKFPFAQICRHAVALDILSLLERNEETIDPELVRYISEAAKGDEQALAILERRKSRG